MSEKEVVTIQTEVNKGHFVYDAEERKQRLLKGASWKDIMMLVASGCALISDGYQNNVMSINNNVLTLAFPKDYTPDMKTNVSNAGLIATIFGQVTIGVCADYFGRKNCIIIATLFLIVGTIMCAASHGTSDNGLLWMLIISRGVTGFGIGAEYPSCSVSANEAANESVRRRGGAFVLVTNLPLSLGGPFACIIFLIIYQITKNNNALWRTMFAIGAFWPLSVFYFRLKMSTSVLYKKSAIKRNIPYWLSLKYCWKRLLGVCITWWLYDFVVFPNGIFSGTIIKTILGPTGTLQKTVEYQLLLTIIAIPGLLVGAFLVDRIGRKWTLVIGFAGYLVIGLIVGCAYYKLLKIVPLFVVFFGLLQSFGNLGPGNCMGLLSSELFPSPIRGHAYGFAAAFGKAGAAIGTAVFTKIQLHLGNRWTFIIAALCGIVGVITALLLIPSLTDDDLLEQDVKYKNYLIENGWKGHFGIADNSEQDFVVESDDYSDKSRT